MGGIGEYMTRDHAECDERFARAEEAAQARDWKDLTARLDAFVANLRRHIALEEEVLFPAFEERTGMSAGPTQMMRAEHEQMRELMAGLGSAAAAQDAASYAGFAETLLMMMQQHNLKEEHILYPMIDQALGGEEQALIGRMQDVGIA